MIRIPNLGLHLGKMPVVLIGINGLLQKNTEMTLPKPRPLSIARG